MNWSSNIARKFDNAAESYDQSASVQAQIARSLTERAIRRLSKSPQAVLDIGCGTGFVAAEIARHWPQANITGIDHAPQMLKQAQLKVPHMEIITGDVAAMDFPLSFDLVFSSMALHWLPDPRASLMKWRQWLKPGGRIFAVLPVAGSFQEWRDLCAEQGMADGLWPLPSGDFADASDAKTELKKMTVEYSSASDFLRRIKSIGAATARVDHKPFAVSVLRRLLDRAPQPFAVTYRLLYIEMQSFGSI